MSAWEREYGTGHSLRHPHEERQQPASMAAPRQQPAENAGPCRRPPPVINAAPRLESPSPPSYELPAHCRPAPPNYHDTVARSRPVDLDRLAFQSGITDADEPRLAYDCEIMPDDIALTYDQLVERGLAEPLAGQGERLPAAAAAAVVRLATNLAAPEMPPGTLEQVAPPAPQPAQMNPAEAAPQAAPAVDANVPAVRDPFAGLRNLPLPLARDGLQRRAEPIDRQQNARLGIAIDTFSNNNNYNNMTTNSNQPIPPSLHFPLYPTSWLDNDAEAKELYQQATTLLEQKRDQHGRDQDWVKKAQGHFHKRAAKEGTDAAKALMRETPQRLRRWESWPMMGGGGMFGGGGGGMGW